MAINYVKLATTAARLVGAAGRTIDFFRYDQSPSDAAKPWNGVVDPNATPDESALGVAAVFVQPTEADKLGMATVDQDLLRAAENVAIVAPGATLSMDLSTANEVTDEGIKYRVIFTEKLRPAGVTLLYFIGLAR